MITKERRNFLQDRLASAYLVVPELEAVRKQLLKIGGVEVVAPLGMEEYVASLLKRGRRFSTLQYLRVQGIPSACHQNCAVIWSQNKGRLSICTGYGLSGDGLWRSHSWLWEVNEYGQGRLIETTQKRKIYFGVELSKAEANRMWRDVR